MSSLKSTTIHIERTINLGNYNSIKVGLTNTYELSPSLIDKGSVISWERCKDDCERKLQDLIKSETKKFSIENTRHLMSSDKEGEWK